MCAADSQTSGFQLGQISQLLLQLVLQKLDFLDFGDVDFPGLGQLQGLVIPAEERHSDLSFYSLDGDAQSRLGHVEGSGGFGKTALLIDGVDVFHFLLH